MRYIIVGATGQLGQEFSRSLPRGACCPLTHEQADVASPQSLEHALQAAETGDVVLNLAAFHDVNGAEIERERAFLINALGAANVAAAAARRGLLVVHFSSDYVFGLEGEKQSPYLEDDPVGACNVYGVSKAAGESLVRSITPNHLIVRTSSLFGAVTSRKGWTFPEMILKRATAREALRVVTDQYMSPTYALDLVSTVKVLVETAARGTFHVTNGGGCSWYEFATLTLRMAGVDYPIQRVDSSEFPALARRPAYSRLDSKRLALLDVPPLRPWQDALRAYLVEKRVIAT